MWFHSIRRRVLAGVLVLSALPAAAQRSQAQDVVAPVDSNDQVPHHRHHLGCGLFHSRCAAIPRTYSYYYDTWFNQPRHFRVVGPDGKIYWRTTVRDLPRGTPWPSR